MHNLLNATQDCYLTEPLSQALQQLLAQHTTCHIILSDSVTRRAIQYQPLLTLIDQRCQYAPQIIASQSGIDVIPDIATNLCKKSHNTVLVFGGGRVNDLVKRACIDLPVSLIICPLTLSNDGFASGCASLPDAQGKLQSLPAKKPTAIIGIESLFQLAPAHIMHGGWGEAFSKFNVLADRLAENPKAAIELNALYDPALSIMCELPALNADECFIQRPDSMARLFSLLCYFSHLMPSDSSACSRSEHEFEKACCEAGVQAAHGLLVLCGALVALKIRHDYAIKPPAIYDYHFLVKRLKALQLTQTICPLLERLVKESNLPPLRKALDALSNLRPNRFGLWNQIDSRTLPWPTLFEQLQQACLLSGP